MMAEHASEFSVYEATSITVFFGPRLADCNTVITGRVVFYLFLCCPFVLRLHLVSTLKKPLMR